MTSVLRRILTDSSRKSEDLDDDYNMEYSFAMEYTGPPVSDDIPQVVPVDIHRIPTALVAATAVISSNLSLSVPVIQPILKIDRQSSENELKSGPEVVESKASVGNSGEIRGFGGVYGTNLGDDSGRDDVLVVVNDSVLDSSVLHGTTSLSSSGTSGFSDCQNDLNQMSASSDVEDLDGDSKPGRSNPTTFYSVQPSSGLQEISSDISSEEREEDSMGETEASARPYRASVVTFRNLPSEESDVDYPDAYPEKAVVSDEGKKGLCHKCRKRNRFSDRETCIVCGSKYCSKCVLRAMGSMPEGRKCVTCIGYRIDESRRGSLGKCSRMLKQLLSDYAVKQIMRSELLCEANQLRPTLVCVNGVPLTCQELNVLQHCSIPPKKLRPGRYWYDKVSGFWGKEGDKPCQIISSQLAIGGNIRHDASKGNTNVLINNREITKAEIWMLKAAEIHYEGNTHFWVTPDGVCQLEGMNNVVGNLWVKKRVKIVCAALSLPYPSHSSKLRGEAVETETDNSSNQGQGLTNKFLLVGCDKSGTSTIFKQAKVVYKVNFSEDEKQDIKFMIQRNLYSYIAILLEGNERFAEEYSINLRRKLADEPGPSEISEVVDARNIYSLSSKLKGFASWLLQVMMAGNLEAIFPAATQVYSPLIEELWKDSGFQATYVRRNELHMLPRVANYFLERAVELSRVEYEPSEMDIMYAEGITSSNGVTSMEFSFPKSPHEEEMETSDRKDPPISYQLIRVHASNLGENCKWLEMFEDVDLVVYCVSLTDYDEYYEDINGELTNKMMFYKKHFETIVTHPTLVDKDFLLILNKIDLLEEKINQVPLTHCDWFRDFNPVFSLHPQSASSNNNPPLAQRAFHYIAMEFKRLFNSLTGKKLFVTKTAGLDADSVDKALRYGREILRWSDEVKANAVRMKDWSSESIEPSSTQ